MYKYKSIVYYIPIQSSHIVLINVTADDGIPEGGVVPLTQIFQLGKGPAGLDKDSNDDCHVV